MIDGGLIDWARLKELRDEIGAEDLAEVAAIFLEEADEVVARLTRTRAPGELAAHLHFLKGSALNLGLQDFAAQCLEGERRLAAGTFAAPELARLVAVYDASKTAFRGALARGVAA